MYQTQVLAFLAIEHELMRVIQLALGQASQPIMQGLRWEPINPDSAIWKRFADDQASRGLIQQLLSDDVRGLCRIDPIKSRRLKSSSRLPPSVGSSMP